MESQPQNSKFRNNPKNFHPCANEITVHDVFNIIILKDRHDQTVLTQIRLL